LVRLPLTFVFLRVTPLAQSTERKLTAAELLGIFLTPRSLGVGGLVACSIVGYGWYRYMTENIKGAFRHTTEVVKEKVSVAKEHVIHANEIAKERVAHTTEVVKEKVSVAKEHVIHANEIAKERVTKVTGAEAHLPTPPAAHGAPPPN
jgi:hypothetical protein